MKQKPKPPREGPLKVPVPFDEAIRRALQVKPPLGGWASLGKTAKKTSKRQR